MVTKRWCLVLGRRGAVSAVSALVVPPPTPAAAATATVHLDDVSDELRADLQVAY